MAAAARRVVPALQPRPVVDNHAAKEILLAAKFHVVDGEREEIRNFDATCLHVFGDGGAITAMRILTRKETHLVLEPRQSA